MDGSLQALRAELNGAVGAEHVDTSENGNLQVDGLAPHLLVSPGSPEQLAAVLKISSGHGAPVIPRGSGTKLGLGNAPEGGDVWVSTLRLDKILEYTPADMTVCLQAGMRLFELQRTLAKEGQFLPLDPPYGENATIGGVMATNSSGPLRAGYGTARDLLIGIRVAHADGALTKAGGKVVKNVTGYDLNKLYIGSLGTLGVFVEANFKLHPLPAVEKTVLGALNSATAAAAAVDALVGSVLMPNSVELLDAGAAAQVMGGVRGGGWTILVKFGGRREAVDRQVSDMVGIFAGLGSAAPEVIDDKDQARLWQTLRELPRTAAEAGDAVCRVSVLSSELPAAFAAAEAVASAAGLGVMAWGRALNGTGYVALAGAAGNPDAARAAIRSLRARLADTKAAVVVESCPTAVKEGLDVWHGPIDPAALEIMRSIKAQFDPKRTLNPGRFVGGI